MPLNIDPDIFTDGHETFRRTVRHFFETQADPFAEQWDEDHAIPRSFWLKAGEAGILGIGVPEEFGGPGGDFLDRVVMTENGGAKLDHGGGGEVLLRAA
ncbi:acyl-CoA dehydrogenase family protein [Sphingobium sp. EM0848]|uniref:acyl-CoA dehydrogenase family protein n=1 Tax=Sphingobium sp. EM0848 TaxID=2743473 RepID=UPI00159C3A33|nr:acyl-CoA dehydrogenase family protein [Sphingobium sp. EM0848]